MALLFWFLRVLEEGVRILAEDKANGDQGADMNTGEDGFTGMLNTPWRACCRWAGAPQGKGQLRTFTIFQGSWREL
jgi:hypothetical protein